MDAVQGSGVHVAARLVVQQHARRAEMRVFGENHPSGAHEASMWRIGGRGPVQHGQDTLPWTRQNVVTRHDLGSIVSCSAHKRLPRPGQTALHPRPAQPHGLTSESVHGQPVHVTPYHQTPDATMQPY